jgi:mono/diheme cytochrome c family protein
LPNPLPDSVAVWVRGGSIGLGLAGLLAFLAIGCADDGSDSLPPEAEEGQRIAVRAGCAGCHGADGEGGVGPAWDDSLGREIELTDGTTVTVDEAYLTRAIADPGAEVHAGFTATMPDNRLTDAEIAEVIDYIVALNAPTGTGASG